MADESIDRARYRVRVARQNLRHAKNATDAERVELREAKLQLRDAKIRVRESKRARSHTRRRSKGFFESEDAYRARMREEA